MSLAPIMSYVCSADPETVKQSFESLSSLVEYAFKCMLSDDGDDIVGCNSRQTMWRLVDSSLYYYAKLWKCCFSENIQVKFLNLQQMHYLR